VSLTQQFLQILPELISYGFSGLLQGIQDYTHQLQLASFQLSSEEKALTAEEFAHYALHPTVLFRFCLEQMFQECRQFGAILMEYMCRDHIHATTRFQLLQQLQQSMNKLKEYRQHITELDTEMHDIKMKEHISCLYHYLS
jgi:hypothetical protein